MSLGDIDALYSQLEGAKVTHLNRYQTRSLRYLDLRSSEDAGPMIAPLKGLAALFCMFP